MNILEPYAYETAVEYIVRDYSQNIYALELEKKKEVDRYIYNVGMVFKNPRYQSMLKRHLLDEPRYIVQVDYLLTICMKLINENKLDHIFGTYDGQVNFQYPYEFINSPLYDKTYTYFNETRRYFDEARRYFDFATEDGDADDIFSLYVPIAFEVDRSSDTIIVGHVIVLTESEMGINQIHNNVYYSIKKEYVPIIVAFYNFMKRYSSDFNEAVMDYF